jgi:chemotaxis protein CheX
MNLHDRIIESLQRASAEVLSTMLGLDLGPGEASGEDAPNDPNDGVVSFIGITGAWVGTGSISCSAQLACHLCAQMLMTDAPAVNEEVLDTTAELTNMIIGNVKTDLEECLGPLGLSIPTVIFGRNFRARTAANSRWSVVRFPWNGEKLVVRMCLAPAERAHSHPLAIGHTCPVEV